MCVKIARHHNIVLESKCDAEPMAGAGAHMGPETCTPETVANTLTHHHVMCHVTHTIHHMSHLTCHTSHATLGRSAGVKRRTPRCGAAMLRKVCGFKPAMVPFCASNRTAAAYLA
eukprot:EG_transcript_25072